MQQVTTRRPGQRLSQPQKSRKTSSGQPADLFAGSGGSCLPSWRHCRGWRWRSPTPSRPTTSAARPLTRSPVSPRTHRPPEPRCGRVWCSRFSLFIGRRHDVGSPSNVAPTHLDSRRFRDVHVLLSPVEPEPQPDRTDHPRARPRRINNNCAGREAGGTPTGDHRHHPVLPDNHHRTHRARRAVVAGPTRPPSRGGRCWQPSPVEFLGSSALPSDRTSARRSRTS